MIPIVCVDDRYGIAFNHRRQSRDRILCADVLKLCGAGGLGCRPILRELFSAAAPEQLRVDEAFLDRARGRGVLLCGVLAAAALCAAYRGDGALPLEPPLSGGPVSGPAAGGDSLEAAGANRLCRLFHEKITREVYGR